LSCTGFMTGRAYAGFFTTFECLNGRDCCGKSVI
jgi:hypothetical protein